MRPFAALLPLLLVSGCYIARQAEGQLRILLERRDLDSMLADPDVPAGVKRQLRLVREIKDFGESAMGLPPSPNFESFYDTGGRPVTWGVSACSKTSFRPHTWWFPIVGDVPYKGFFRREDALDEARALAAEGYDVTLGGIDAYSTLGYFADPVLSTMLDMPEEQLAALLLHELTHGFRYFAGKTDFNERLASFVGWQGALEFARRRGVESAVYARAVRAFAFEERRDALAGQLFEKLDKLYRSGEPTSAILERREEVARGLVDRLRRERNEVRERLDAAAPEDVEEARARLDSVERLLLIFGRPVNNAEILSHRRYGGYGHFRAVFEKCGADWRRFFEAVTNPAASGDSAPSPP